jgi:hypothetical protein
VIDIWVEDVSAQVARITFDLAQQEDGGDAEARQNPALRCEPCELRDQLALPAQHPSKDEEAAVDGERRKVR